MKKLLSVLLLLAMITAILASCGGNQSSEKSDVKISVLSGSTGFGMAYLMGENEKGTAKNNYTFAIEENAADITRGLSNGSIDIAALPTNAASTLYNKDNSKIKLLALNTLGVLYVVENGNTIESIKDLEGKKIYCPAQNPEYILKSILIKNGIYTEGCIDTTYAAPKDLNKALASGEIKEQNIVAVLPQPVLTTTLSKNNSLRVALDLNEEWGKVEQTQLVQGCVVVRTEFLNNNPDAVTKFLAEYEQSIDMLKNNIDEVAPLVVKYNMIANENIAKAAIPKCNVTFIVNNEMKSYMNGFLAAMAAIAPSSIGNKLPDDNFYYINE